MEILDNIPIFPLRTIVFPGGELPLQIFEQRYLRMVSYCLQQETFFGVCLINGTGSEVGEKVDYFKTGTLLKIVDFDKNPNGTLNILASSFYKMEVLESEYEDDGLLMAKVNIIEDEYLDVMPPAFSNLQQVLEKLLLNSPEGKSIEDYDTPTKIINALSNIAPVALRKKQNLLECQSDLERIKLLSQFFADLNYTMLA